MPGEQSPDWKLLQRLLAETRPLVEAQIRVGTMFGCAAAFVGRRLAFCVCSGAIGAKLPQAEAARLIASSEATPFRPFGRSPMREWVELRADPHQLASISPILVTAVRYADNRA